MKLASALPNVFFIGGPMCSGKSSTANYLAKKYRVAVYHADTAHEQHVKHVSRQQFPYMYQVSQRPWSQAFLRLPRWMLGDLLRIYREEIAMTFHDLQQYPKGSIVIAEGTVFTPRLIRRFVKPEQVVYLIAIESFQLSHGLTRGAWVKQILSQYPDPDKTYKRWMKRDALFSDYVKRGAKRYHYQSIDVTGELDLGAIEHKVDAYLEGFLQTGVKNK